MSKLIVANWKSHKNTSQAQTWLQTFSEGLETSITADKSLLEEASVIICPAFPQLSLVSEFWRGAQSAGSSIVSVGIQDLSSFPAGSYTGAVSTSNLEGFGVRYAILGHSERRRYFHETHQDVAKKVELAVAAQITPIVCVDDEYIAEQAAAIDASLWSKCVVAYEELSAIGTGDNVDPLVTQKVIDRIKHVFGQVPVLYGGSVAPENASGYFAISDGVLVGSKSLEADSFLGLLRHLR